MHDTETAPQYGRFPAAERRFGLSRSRLYVLAGEGIIRFVKVGNATLVDFESVQHYLASCPNAQIRPPKQKQTIAILRDQNAGSSTLRSKDPRSAESIRSPNIGQTKRTAAASSDGRPARGRGRK